MTVQCDFQRPYSIGQKVLNCQTRGREAEMSTDIVAHAHNNVAVTLEVA
jgi:hypothetical protein